MSTFAKNLLSGSIDGKAILVTATATPGTVIHTAGVGETNFDEVWLWAVNNTTAAVKLTIEYGEATAPQGNIQGVVPAQSGLFMVVPGLLIQNSLVIKAFAGTGSVISIHGFVNRITP